MAKEKMEQEKFYSIGEVSKICNISKKTLRFYDQIGLIEPDKIDEVNNYRYYNSRTLHTVPVIKYFKQMGFKLEEMRAFLEGAKYSTHRQGFNAKIEELKAQQAQIDISVKSIEDWHRMILEAESVIDHQINDVSVKYMDALTSCAMEQDFDYDYIQSVVNIEWTNHLEELGQSITGPVMLHFENGKEKMNGDATKVTILQESLFKDRCGSSKTIGGHFVASCYHIGDHNQIGETYKKIYDWIDEHNYQADGEAVERYIADYWATKKTEDFVTEVLIHVSR